MIAAIAALTLIVSVPGTATAAPKAIRHWSQASPEVQAEHTPEQIQAFIDGYWWNKWMEGAARQEAERIAAAARPTGHCYIEGIRVCDGPGLLPYHIVWRESRMDPRARNSASSAGGYAQMLIGTFRSVCPNEATQYGNAAFAPVSVQVECVRRLIAKHGLRPWRF